MERSLRFYRDIVGLPVRRRFASGEGSEICFLGEDETQVELIRDAVPRSIAHGKDVSLGFMTPSLDLAIEGLARAGITSFEGPFRPGPDIRFIYAQDPDGARVQFVERSAQR